MDEESKRLLKESNELLKKVLALLTNEDCRAEEDFRQLCINLTANILYDVLKNNRELLSNILKNFKV